MQQGTRPQAAAQPGVLLCQMAPSWQPGRMGVWAGQDSPALPAPPCHLLEDQGAFMETSSVHLPVNFLSPEEMSRELS